MFSPIKQNPFSLYDFIGYLIPGILFWGTIFYVDLVYLVEKRPILYFFEITNIKIVFLVPFALSVMYLTGHLLALLSNITIEEFERVNTLGKASGYSICNKKKENNRSIIDKIVFYAGISATRNPFKFIVNNFIWLFILIPETIFIYLLCLVKEKQDSKINTFYKKQEFYMPNLVKNKIKELIAIHFEDCFDESKINCQQNEYFHFIYHYVLENAGQHIVKIQNYVALYGFLRNTLMASLLVSIFVFFSWFLTVYKFELFIFLIMLLVFNFILFYGYIKFERRYNEEVLFAISSLKIDKLS